MSNRKFGPIKLIFLCLVVAVVSAVPTLTVARHKRARLEDSLKGTVSAYQGIINIWNVDTFEGGSQSKTMFLENATNKFSKQYKGLYFLVKNIGVEELVQSLLSGVKPDIISFGHGIGDIVKPILEELVVEEFSEVRSEILNAGQYGGKQYAIGYLMGGYIFASTEEKLAFAGLNSDTSLSAVLNTCGVDTETKKGVKHTASVVVGENDYILPQMSVSNTVGVGLSDVYSSINSYEAYMDFVAYNKGTILLGTHRDLYKLSGRVAIGKISGVKVEYLSGYTNLVQYIGVVQGSTGEKLELMRKFTSFLVGEECQSYSAKVGMVNVLKKNFYTEGEFLSLEQCINQDLTIPTVFD